MIIWNRNFCTVNWYKYLLIIIQYNFLISKHIFPNGLQVFWCRYHKTIAVIIKNVSPADFAWWFQGQCHRRIFHVYILLSMAKTYDNHRGITQNYREFFSESSNLFPPTFHSSGWLYGDEHCHEAKPLVCSKIHAFSYDIFSSNSWQ